MTAAEIVNELQSKGLVLWAEGDRLRYRGPAGVLTDPIRSALVSRKAELIAFLTEVDSAKAARLQNIPVAPPTGELPLSFAEEGLWLTDQLRPGMTTWNMQSVTRIRGELDVSVLRKSLNALIQRQEILRTGFKLMDKGPLRIIASQLSVDLSVVELNQAVSSDDSIRSLASEDRKRPFDLSRPPLLRVTLLRLNNTEHIFLLTTHHIITDAWSKRIFFRELFALYGAYAVGHTPPLADLPIQYSDYATSVRQAKSSVMESHFFYWKNKLDGMRVVELPRDKHRTSERSFNGATQHVRLSKDLSRSLRDLCKQERLTQFMILLAAFKVLLYRYTGESDIVVGSTLAGRNKQELEHLIGMFINLLPLRSNLSGHPTFRQLLTRVREVCLEAYQHQDFPFEKLVQELSPARQLTGNHLFQVLFNVVNLPSVPTQVNGLILERIGRTEDTARFDLTLYAPGSREATEIVAAYNTDIFSDARIIEMLEQYKYLLEQLVEDPDQSIDDYSLVTPSARRVLPDPTAPLDDRWHGAAHEIFARYAGIHPHKLAVEDRQGAWSYGELNESSNRLAHYLLSRGIQRENIIAVYGERSSCLVWALLGILKAGASFLIIDPAHPARRVREYLDVAAPVGLIQIGEAATSNAEMIEVFESFPLGTRLKLPESTKHSVVRLLSEYDKDNPGVEVFADNLAYIIFTSGSTGKPKAVMGRHGPLTHFLPWIRETFGLSEDDHFSFLASLSTNKLQREILTALTLGGTLHIPDTSDIGTFGWLDEWMRKRAITVVHLTPAMVQLLDDTARGPIPTVRQVFFGGDLLRMRDVDRVRRLMPEAEVVNFYNSSETQRGGGYKVFGRDVSGHYKNIPPLGRGVKDVQLLVVNKSGQMAGVGELGEIQVRSPHMARGFLGDEELTNTRFITNPFTGMEGDRVYRTGEQGRVLPNGEIEFIARNEDQFSIRGFRVELGEIETVLSSHPAVGQSVVVGYEAPSEHLVAYYCKKRGQRVTVSEMRDFLSTRLPNYMIPAKFILLQSMPLTPTGKIDRRALPAPEKKPLELEKSFVAPRNEIEHQLTKIWEKVFDVKSIGVTNNFFDLGGHSLLAVKLFAEIEKTLGRRLPLATIFQAPTIAELAGMLRTEEGSESQTSLWLSYPSSVVPFQPTGSKPPLFWFNWGPWDFRLPRYLGSDQPVYGLQHQSQDGHRALYTSIEDMAAYYIKEIRTVQAQGPYYIGGLCIGAMVAFEMAQQLQKQGEEVALLVLLDPNNPWSGKLSSATKDVPNFLSFTTWLRNIVNRHLRELAPLEPHEKLSYALVSVQDKITGLRGRISWRVRRVLCEAFGCPLPLDLRTHYIANIYGRASRTYVPQPYRGRVILYKTQGRYRNRQLRWQDLIAGGLDIHELDTDHDNIFKEPYVKTFAERLKTRLSDAQVTATAHENSPVYSSVA